MLSINYKYSIINSHILTNVWESDHCYKVIGFREPVNISLIFSYSVNLIVPEVLHLSVRKTVLRGNTKSSFQTRYKLNWLGDLCNHSFPIFYKGLELEADNVTFDFYFSILHGTYSFEQASLLIRGPISDRVIKVHGYKYYGFRFGVNAFNNVDFPKEIKRDDSWKCGWTCGAALFRDYAKTKYLCIQLGAKLFYLNLDFMGERFNVKRVLLLKLSTHYRQENGSTIKSSETFLVRPCSIEEITQRNIGSNFIILVANKRRKQKISFCFIDIDGVKHGPYNTKEMENSGQECSELKNNNFKMTGFTIKDINSLNPHNISKCGNFILELIQNQQNAIFMIPLHTKQISCRMPSGM
ncbi:hypothetical protein HZS_4234, partial [Henneguya salminicola]